MYVTDQYRVMSFNTGVRGGGGRGEGGGRERRLSCMASRCLFDVSTSFSPNKCLDVSVVQRSRTKQFLTAK